MSGDLAEDLWRARNSGGTLTPSAGDSLATVAEAYAVQRRIAALAAMRRFGWKVGATSEVAQRLRDTPGPATAPLLEPLCFESSTTFMVFPGQDTSVECEFAFRFAHALPPRDAEYGRDEVLDAVDLLMPAIEIVACRFAGGFTGLGELRLVADMVANAAWVRGLEATDWRGRDLVNHPIVLRRDGEAVAKGTGAQVLGDPLCVLEWTANHLSRLGDGIAAGEVVSTGTCTGVVAVQPGDVMTAEFGDLGAVEVALRARVRD